MVDSGDSFLLPPPKNAGSFSDESGDFRLRVLEASDNAGDVGAGERGFRPKTPHSLSSGDIIPIFPFNGDNLGDSGGEFILLELELFDNNGDSSASSSSLIGFISLSGEDVSEYGGENDISGSGGDDTVAEG